MNSIVECRVNASQKQKGLLIAGIQAQRQMKQQAKDQMVVGSSPGRDW